MSTTATRLITLIMFLQRRSNQKAEAAEMESSMEEGYEIVTVDAGNVDRLSFFCCMSKPKAPGYRQKRDWLLARWPRGCWAGRRMTSKWPWYAPRCWEKSILT